MERKEKGKKDIVVGITHEGSPHLDDLLSICILSYHFIHNYSILVYVIRNSNIDEIIEKINELKEKYNISNIFVLDQTLQVEIIKEKFKNIEIIQIDHHSINSDNCTFQLLLEKLYPEYSLYLHYNDILNFDIDFSNFSINKTFKPINYIYEFLKTLSIADTQGPFASFKYLFNKNIENIEEVLRFEYLILKNPLNYSILKLFTNKKSFLITSKSNIFYIVGEVIVNQLFSNNKKIRDLEFKIIDDNLIIVKSKKRYLDTHILKFTLEYFNLELNNNLVIIYIKNSSRNLEQYSIHLINISDNKKFNIEKMKELISLKFIHGNNRIIAIDKSDYNKFIELLRNYDDLII